MSMNRLLTRLPMLAAGFVVAAALAACDDAPKSETSTTTQTTQDAKSASEKAAEESKAAADSAAKKAEEAGDEAAKAGDKGGSFQGAMAVSPGVWFYQLTDDGLAAELTAKGTKYYKDGDLN